MLASEIAVGDEYSDGTVYYTVEKVWREGTDVLAAVRYLDGGDSIRVWDENREVPLKKGPVD